MIGIGLKLSIGSMSVSRRATYSLFNTTPSNFATTDTAAYEMGTRFVATVPGDVVGLRYYRGPAVGSVTRILRLWEAAGTFLGSVTVTSTSGPGWIVGALATPITLTVGAEYVASYNKATEMDYASDSGFFATAHTGPGGILTAPSGGNGIFNSGTGPGNFPTETFNSTNYYADVIFRPA